MSYRALAPQYDAFTRNVEYGKRAAYFHQLLGRYKEHCSLVVDLGCGTGSLSVELARRGYDVIGVDNSPEMLSIAMSKSAGVEPSILYLCQDMARLDLYGTVDAVICALDTVNHVTDPHKLARAFGRVALFLEPDGLFLFDVNTPYKHREVLGENVFVYQSEDAYCVWQNHQQGPLVEMTLDIFSQEEDGRYTRQTDTITERVYPREELERMIRGAGLELLAVYGDDTFAAPDPTAQRAIYVTRKAGGK